MVTPAVLMLPGVRCLDGVDGGAQVVPAAAPAGEYLSVSFVAVPLSTEALCAAFGKDQPTARTDRLSSGCRGARVCG